MKTKQPKNRFKSSLEQKFHERCLDIKLPCTYETAKFSYAVPEHEHMYVPDFQFGPNTFVETKGRLTIRDRQKMLLVKEQWPETKFILIFERPKQRLSKTSKTEYWQWAEKNGFEWGTITDLSPTLKLLVAAKSKKDKKV